GHADGPAPEPADGRLARPKGVGQRRDRERHDDVDPDQRPDVEVHGSIIHTCPAPPCRPNWLQLPSTRIRAPKPFEPRSSTTVSLECPQTWALIEPARPHNRVGDRRLGNRRVARKWISEL